MAAMTTVFRDICSKCLYEDPSRYDLVTFKCFDSDRHRGEQKMDVCWNFQSRELEPMLYPSQDDSAERQSRIRPMPTVLVTRKFALCNPLRRKCRGEKCTYAHSIEERDAWNARLFYMAHWQRETRRLYMYSYVYEAEFTSTVVCTCFEMFMRAGVHYRITPANRNNKFLSAALIYST